MCSVVAELLDAIWLNLDWNFGVNNETNAAVRNMRLEKKKENDMQPLVCIY